MNKSIPVYRAELVARLFRDLIGPSPKEHFCVAALDTRFQAFGVSVVSIGTLSASLIRPREVFQCAILADAAAVVAGHNHPSRDCLPSEEDKKATRRLLDAGKLLGIPLVDHVIIGQGDSYYSFADAGLL